jgi:hypothetical protein
MTNGLHGSQKWSWYVDADCIFGDDRFVLTGLISGACKGSLNYGRNRLGQDSREYGFLAGEDLWPSLLT